MKRIDLTDRGVIRIAGEDTRTFLQGLVSNDVMHADGSRAVYSALLTPQGKFLFDFFIVADGDALLLDCRADDVAALIKKLTLFKLRSKATLEDRTDTHRVVAFIGDGWQDALGLADTLQRAADGAILYADPRLADAGARAIVPADADAAALGGEAGEMTDYERHRIGLGLPAAPLDLVAEKSILLESGFDELNGVDWKKGCYMGQELTARTKYRGLVKKRLVPVVLSGAAEPGTDLVHDGRTVGELRSVADGRGIAMLRLDAIRAGARLDADGAGAEVRLPHWLSLPAEEDAAG